VRLRDGAAELELFGVFGEELWQQVCGELEAEGVALLEGLQELKVTVWAKPRCFESQLVVCASGKGGLHHRASEGRGG
jgi:hypothetical protein